MHGLFWHASRISHRLPEYPGGHTQRKPPFSLMHVPWFMHGWEAQGSPNKNTTSKTCNKWILWCSYDLHTVDHCSQEDIDTWILHNYLEYIMPHSSKDCQHMDHLHSHASLFFLSLLKHEELTCGTVETGISRRTDTLIRVAIAWSTSASISTWLTGTRIDT